LRDGQRWVAQVVQRLDRVGEIEEAVGVYAETKIEDWRNGNFGSIIRSSLAQPENE
jgi:hypothetical protein